MALVYMDLAYLMCMYVYIQCSVGVVSGHVRFAS